MNEIVRVSTDAAINYAASPLAGRQAYISQLAMASSLLPRTVQRNTYEEQLASTFYIAEVGAMMGIHPIEALTGIHLIEGRPTISAGLMSAMIRKAGHKLRVTESGSWADKTYVARAVIIRADDPEFEHVAEFGYEDAEMAQLISKRGPWQNYPKSMCKARAISAVGRAAAEDALGGARYTPEELGARVNEEGEPVDLGHVEPDQPAQSQQQAPAPSVRPTEAAQAPAAAAPAAVSDEAILANLPEGAAQHSVSAWVAAGAFDLEALHGVWQSAKKAKLLQTAAVVMNDDESIALWRRGDDGAPMILNAMISELGAKVKQILAEREAAEVSAQDASAEQPDAKPDDAAVEGELMDPEGGGDDPQAV